jgi:nitrate reductase cytochrome c-type subunit
MKKLISTMALAVLLIGGTVSAQEKPAKKEISKSEKKETAKSEKKEAKSEKKEAKSEKKEAKKM